MKNDDNSRLKRMSAKESDTQFDMVKAAAIYALYQPFSTNFRVDLILRLKENYLNNDVVLLH